MSAYAINSAKHCEEITQQKMLTSKITTEAIEARLHQVQLTVAQRRCHDNSGSRDTSVNASVIKWVS